MYFPQTVNGPYTRMSHDGIPKVEKKTTITVEGTDPVAAGYGK